MRTADVTFVAAAVLVTGTASYLAFAPGTSGTVAFWGLAGGPAILLGVIAAAWAKREDLLGEWLTPRWGDFTRGILGAGMLYALAWVFVHVVAPVGSAREVWLVPLYGQLGDPRILQAHAPPLAAWIAAAALAEEVVWRGMVTQVLAERVGSRAAWVWSAGLYALAYAPTLLALRTGAGVNPILLFAAAAGGLFWGGLARASGRLFPAVLAHAAFAWAVVIMLPLWGPYALQL